MKPSLVPLLACPSCRSTLEAPLSQGNELLDGELRCTGCAVRFPVRHGIPILLNEPTAAEAKTQQLYGDIWQEFTRVSSGRRAHGYEGAAPSHLELLRRASGREIAQGEVGLDAGCGNGAGVIEMAGRFPSISFVGIDLAPGLVVMSNAAGKLPNAHLVQGKLLAPPVAHARFDFVYSFGVLHHTRDPEGAFRQLLGCLRPRGRVTVFVYKDFSDLPAKRMLLAPVTALRRVTTRLPAGTLRRLAWLGAPVVFALLTLPARLLRRVGAGRFARHIPYGIFPDVHSVASSLEDRFGAPYEHRFSKRDLEGWASRAGLASARVVDFLPHGFSGLVLSGEVPTAG